MIIVCLIVQIVLAWIKLENGVALLRLVMIVFIGTASGLLKPIQIDIVNVSVRVMREIALVFLDYFCYVLDSVFIVY